jgi:hypothetical protein
MNTNLFNDERRTNDEEAHPRITRMDAQKSEKKKSFAFIRVIRGQTAFSVLLVFIVSIRG